MVVSGIELHQDTDQRRNNELHKATAGHGLPQAEQSQIEMKRQREMIRQ
jgi:hypothetical protein